MRKTLAPAARGARWVEAATFFYPLRPDASLPPVLEALGRQAAAPLAEVMALAQLPAPLGANPFQDVSWPAGGLVDAEVTHYGAGAHGLDPTIRSVTTEPRWRPHPVHALFVAVADAASRLSAVDVALALAR